MELSEGERLAHEAWDAFSAWLSRVDVILDGESDCIPMNEWTVLYGANLTPEDALLAAGLVPHPTREPKP